MCENYDILFPDQPVVDLYLPMWAKHQHLANKPAFKWVDEAGNEQCSLTYSELHASASTIASNLRSTLRKGDTVLILCPPGIEFVGTIFGCQRAGLVSVPMLPPHPSFSSQEDCLKLVRILQQIQPKAAIAHPTYISSVMKKNDANEMGILLKKMQWISLVSLFKANGPEISLINGGENKYSGCREEDLYLIQYTSGATGNPKPVMITAGSAAHNVREARKAYDLEPWSVIVSWLPQYHDCGLMFLLLTIVSAATCILTSPFMFIKRPTLWLEMVSKYKATCTPVPSFALPLVQNYMSSGSKGESHIKLNLETLRNLIVINEPIYGTVVESFVKKFSVYGLSASAMAPSYGLAENCTFVSTAWGPNISQTPTYRGLLPCARICSQLELDIEMIVVDPKTCEEVEAGEEGEIWISSPSNADGYLDNPWLTNEVFLARPKRKGDWDKGRFYLRTGDMGVITKGIDQYLYITGRLKDIIRARDRLVHPHYLETTAFMSCTQSLRAGCAAAFEADITRSNKKVIVVLAELQNFEHKYITAQDEGRMKRICENIYLCIEKEHGVAVGFVGLVKARCIPKTTSGKLQRWKTGRQLMTGEMELVHKEWFGLGNYNNVLFMCCNGRDLCERCRGLQLQEFTDNASTEVNYGFLKSLM
ncbi:hypothetical protein SUGI_0368390 [Cryptomeria japonica]|uniref:uncharacterized protein LOC131028147 n=1 Tax=Cryptomeria japonica TaxID=3369 RepID=UPI002408B665|nr:uncharacterized protein LOC131028147 [Cryptomeria japonica]GLJ20287.1 hypothetical protein SUGI_0368390 [Cryptomeria japonica]